MRPGQAFALGAEGFERQLGQLQAALGLVLALQVVVRAAAQGFGGVGNLWGTLVAGLTLGVAKKLLEPVAGAMLAKILILVAIILFIQKRPRGLFPQRGRAVEG
mgnify:CR=1 FL=1